MERRVLKDEELDAVVGGVGGTCNSKRNTLICECGESLTFFHNEDPFIKYYCSHCKKVYRYNPSTLTLTETGETVPF